MPRRGPSIASASLDLIRTDGPMTLDELTPRLVAAGRTAAKDPRRAVASAIGGDPRFLEDLRGTFYSITEQIEGAVFTVHLTNLERREDIVLIRPDLFLLQRLLTVGRWSPIGDGPHLEFFGDHFGLPVWGNDVIGEDEDGRPIFDNRPLRERVGDETADRLLVFLEELGLPGDPEDDENLRDLVDEMSSRDVIRGPDGWLPLLGPRDLLGLRVEGGVVRPVAVDRRAAIGVHVEMAAHRIARIAHRFIGPDESWFGPDVLDLGTLLILVATEAPEILRRPMPPLVEVVERGGLVVADGWVGHRGTDFDRFSESRHRSPEDAWGFEPPDAVQ